MKVLLIKDIQHNGLLLKKGTNLTVDYTTARALAMKGAIISDLFVETAAFEPEAEVRKNFVKPNKKKNNGNDRKN